MRDTDWRPDMSCVPGTTKISLCVRTDLLEEFEAIYQQDVEGGVMPYSLTELVNEKLYSFLYGVARSTT